MYCGLHKVVQGPIVQKLLMKSTTAKLLQESPIIIIGMHRSGTSMLARLLNDLGIYIGQDLSENAESYYFQHLNRKIFAGAGGHWCNVMPIVRKLESPEFVDQQAAWLERMLFGRSSLVAFFTGIQQVKLFFGFSPGRWGWKDPRNSITLPIWLSVFPRSRVIHITRNGIDVAISVHRRQLTYLESHQDFSERCLDFGWCFQLWHEYIYAISEYHQLVWPEHYLEVRYEEILRDPRRQLISILKFLGYRVKDERLTYVASMVDSDRLNNGEYREHYHDEIGNLSTSPLMKQLGYA